MENTIQILILGSHHLYTFYAWRLVKFKGCMKLCSRWQRCFCLNIYVRDILFDCLENKYSRDTRHWQRNTDTENDTQILTEWHRFDTLTLTETATHWLTQWQTLSHGHTDTYWTFTLTQWHIDADVRHWRWSSRCWHRHWDSDTDLIVVTLTQMTHWCSRKRLTLRMTQLTYLAVSCVALGDGCDDSLGIFWSQLSTRLTLSPNSGTHGGHDCMIRIRSRQSRHKTYKPETGVRISAGRARPCSCNLSQDKKSTAWTQLISCLSKYNETYTMLALPSSTGYSSLQIIFTRDVSFLYLE